MDMNKKNDKEVSGDPEVVAAAASPPALAMIGAEELEPNPNAAGPSAPQSPTAAESPSTSYRTIYERSGKG